MDVEDMVLIRVKSLLGNQYSYPDAVVVCGEPEYEIFRGLETLINPTIVIEILSPSTANFDKGIKWMNYQQMPTLQHYLLIWQDAPRIEYFSRHPDGYWKYNVVEGLDKSLLLENLGWEISLPHHLQA